MTPSRTTTGETPVIGRDTAFTWPVVVTFLAVALAAGGAVVTSRHTAQDVADLKAKAEKKADKERHDADRLVRVEEGVNVVREEVKTINRKLDRALGGTRSAGGHEP